MATPFDSLASRRAIIDRRTIADSLIAIISEHEGNATKVRQAIVTRLKQALTEGRIEIGRRLLDHPSRGREAAAAQAFLIDQIIRPLYDATIQYLYPINNPTLAERIAIMGVGGYGRGEMAPNSDVAIAFFTTYKPTGWKEQVIRSEEHTSELKSQMSIS